MMFSSASEDIRSHPMVVCPASVWPSVRSQSVGRLTWTAVVACPASVWPSVHSVRRSADKDSNLLSGPEVEPKVSETSEKHTIEQGQLQLPGVR